MIIRKCWLTWWLRGLGRRPYVGDGRDMGDSEGPLTGLCKPNDVQQFWGLDLPLHGLPWDPLPSSETNNTQIHSPKHDYTIFELCYQERDVGSILVDSPNSKEMYSFPGGKVRLMIQEP